MVRLYLLKRVARPPQTLLPLPPWQDQFACNPADSDRSISETPKKDQIKSTGEETQAALAAILARLEAGPVVPQVVVPNDKDYPPLPQTGANSKRKTTTTKPGFTMHYYYYWPALQEHQFADTVKKRLTHQQLVERQPDFCKADAAAWLALRRDTLIPAHSAPKVELSSGIPDSSMQVVSPYAKPGDLRKAMQGARIRTSAVRAPITDVEMSVSITYLRSILAPILGHQMEHVSKIDRRTTKHGARFRITVPEDRQRKHHPAPRAPKQANPLAYSAKLPTSPSRPASTNSPTSTTITADPRSQCCQHQQQTSCYPPHRQEHQALGHLRDLHHFIKFRFTVPGFDVIQHPATGPGRRGIALGIPSCFGGHEHGSAVGTMILAKVPNFTPECLWIVGSVYVGHSGATTNYSRREAFASIRQALDRVVPLTTTILFSFLETGTPTHSAFSALSTRGVMV
ncbi:hypothetical protein BASA61_002114 [Batrachochytrium salamandrivorans]|nr:hypothetical protein BASA61_002114 [Batrachochytrium salamandrivorans]